MILTAFQFQGRIHGFVKFSVAALLPEIKFGYMWRIDKIIAIFQVFFFPEIFNQIANNCPFWLPDDQAGSEIVTGMEEPEFLAQAAVITFSGFFQKIQIIIKFFLAEEGRSINSL